MWDSGISRNFGTIISESYWDILHMFTAGVCGKKKRGLMVDIIELKLANYH